MGIYDSIAKITIRTNTGPILKQINEAFGTRCGLKGIMKRPVNATVDSNACKCKQLIPSLI